MNLKNVLKGKQRFRKVAKFVADRYRTNVDPLGYMAFLVGIDREACVHYKHALDQFAPPKYSEVVCTGSKTTPRYSRNMWEVQRGGQPADLRRRFQGCWPAPRPLDPRVDIRCEMTYCFAHDCPVGC